MFQICPRFSLYFQLKNVLNFNFVRNLHNTFSLNVKTIIKVNDYLFDRSVPATTILNSLNCDDAARLEEIKNEIDFYLASGELIPKVVTNEHLVELLCLSSGQRKRYLAYLTKREFKYENELSRKSLKASAKQINFQDGYNETKITNKFMSKYFNVMERKLIINRMYQALNLNSQEIIFDFSYENEMSRRDVWDLAKQMQYCYSINKSLKDPFQMVFSNLASSSMTYFDLNKTILKQNDHHKKLEDLPIVVNDKSYLDLYPGRKFIYLSPDSNKYFQEGEFNHEAIYIIAAIVDKSVQYPLSIAKARKEKIDHRCIPLDRYVDWKQGHRGLPLNHVFNIMQIARETNGNWGKAIRESVATRSLIPAKQKIPVLCID